MSRRLILVCILFFLEIFGVLCVCPDTVNQDVKGWGPNCAYRCNCLYNVQCDKTSGECPNGCGTGWMGPACQYQNIISRAKPDTVYQNPGTNNPQNFAKLAIDGNISTCSRTGSSVTGDKRRFWNAEFDSYTYFVGLVLKIKADDAGNFRGFSVEIANSTSSGQICYTHGADEDGSPYMNISCVKPLVGTILRIYLAPEQTSDLFLCEVEVYGGRLVSFRKQTTIESVLIWNGTWDSFYAVDGRGPNTTENQNNPTARTCAATLERDIPSHKWLLLDLAEAYSIQAVNFYGRREAIGQFQNFVIRDGDTNETIFTDGSANSVIANYHPKSHYLTWPIDTRSVRVDRTDVRILVVCELEIFADCPYGKCGWNCEVTCMCNTAGSHKINGQCPNGCAGRWTGENKQCTKECQSHEWGPHCNKSCGHCQQVSSCSVTNGDCPGPCEPGWKPAVCIDACDKGTFGINCLEMCGHCVNGESCDVANGACKNGCADGYMGHYCNRTCVAGWFGQNCSHKCGKCLNGEDCHYVNGTCPKGCAAGYTGKYCTDICDNGTYGIGCTNRCGQCKNGITCNHTSGICVNGCQPGWQTSLCNETCDAGYYGNGCKDECGHCFNETGCIPFNGSCRTGCAAGFQGLFCNTSCDAGKYGRNCAEICGSCGSPEECNKTSGICSDKCQAGWTGEFCKTPCEDGFFGIGCRQVCGRCKTGYPCDKESGTCISCESGYQEQMCKEPCVNNTYGENCQSTCGKCNENAPCNATNGMCERGCLESYGGALCQERLVQPGKDENKTTVTAVVVGVVVPAVVIFVAFLVFINRRKILDKVEKQRKLFSDKAVAEETASSSNLPADRKDQEIPEVEYNNISNVHRASDKEILVAKLRAVCLSASRDPEFLYKEFKELPYGLHGDASEAINPDYKPKNRYKDMYPYNATRVHLPELPGVPSSTYINASYIDGYSQPKQYIAAQGAMKTTIDDIWRMVWSENIKSIVMLTDCMEAGKLKSEKYWPDNDSCTYGEICVELESTREYADFKIRTFKCSKPTSTVSRRVTHFHYTAWPDKDVPDTALTIVQFWRVVREHDSTKHKGRSPMLVHCSAGVGRTGTFIAADYLFDQGNAEGSVNVMEGVYKLRQQRLNLVQTKEQYVLLHSMLAEILDPVGTVCPCDEFPEVYSKLLSNRAINKQKLFTEYQQVCKACEEIFQDKEESVVYGNIGQQATNVGGSTKLPENVQKSRNPDIYPEDADRPWLNMAVKGCNDFINAVYLPTYRYRNRMIITQCPLEHTVVDFLRMVWQYQIADVVLLEEAMPSQEETYWPTTKKVKAVGPFITEVLSEEKQNSFISRTILLRVKGESAERKFRQYHFQAWPSNREIPVDTASITQLLSAVDINLNWDGTPPLVVQCLDGAKRSGVFCMLYIIFERIKLDREVAVAETVRMARVKRRQIIDNYEQYKYIYDVVHDYLQNSSVYANT